MLREPAAGRERVVERRPRTVGGRSTGWRIGAEVVDTALPSTPLNLAAVRSER